MKRGHPITAFLLAATALATPAVAGKADNSLRFGSPFVIANADPYFNTLTVGGAIADAVWDTLIYRDPETGEFKGELATAWRWIDDKTLELDLREGVTFHNGAPLDADDVVYTLNFASKPANKAFNLTLLRWIDHVDKLGKFKVRIIARQPFPAALAYLADPAMVIHPHEYYARVGPKGMNEKPVGSGPFRVVEHALGKYIRLERSQSYWNGGPKSSPKIDRIEIRYIPDAQTRVAEMVAGGLDFVWNVARDQAEQLRDVQSLRVISSQTQLYSFLQINTLPSTAKELRDIRVRQAIMHAIDRPTIAKFMVGEDAQVLHAPCHPLQFGCSDEGVLRYDYDPAKARKLLADAGYPKGFDIDIYAFVDRNRSEAIIGYLRAVGIRAQLHFLEATALLNARRSGRVPLSDYSFSSRSVFDVSNTVSRFFEFSPDDTNRDGEVRDLLLRGDSAMDSGARKEAYNRALKLIAERAYALPLYSLPIYYLAARDLAFSPYADGTPRFSEMYYR